MSQFKAFFLTLFFIPIVLYSVGLYTSSIETEIIDADTVSISWRANEQTGIFAIYRNSEKTISTPENVIQSRLVGIIETAGTLDKSLYQYPAYTDTLTESGSYYYAVLPYQSSYTESDLAAMINYTLFPVDIDITKKTQESRPIIYEQVEEEAVVEEVVIEETVEEIDENKPLFVKDLFISKTESSAVLFWDVSRYTDDSLIFKIYRSTNLITNYYFLKNQTPMKILIDEFYYEDFSVLPGINYYYTVMVNTVTNITMGKNINREPVLFDGSDIEVIIETEIISNEFLVTPYRYNELEETEKEIEETIQEQERVNRILNVIYDDNDNIRYPYDSWLSNGTNVVDIVVQITNYYIIEETNDIEPIQVKETNKLDLIVERQPDTNRTHNARDNNNQNHQQNQIEERVEIIPQTNKIKPETNFITVEVEQEPVIITNFIEIVEVVQFNEEKIEVIEIVDTIEETNYTTWRITDESFLTDDRATVVETEFTSSPETTQDMNQIDLKTIDNVEIRFTDSFSAEESTENATEITENIEEIVNNSDDIIEIKDTVDYFSLGVESYNAKNYNEAIDYFSQAEGEDALLYLGKSYYYLSRFEDALKSFFTLSNINPDKAELWIRLTTNRIGDN